MLQRVRLYSGLILMAFVTSHLANHAFGLISFQAMEEARRTVFSLWHARPFNQLLLLALLVHTTASLVIVVRQRTARLPWWQILQIVSGALIPILLAGHVVGTMGVQKAHSFPVDYYFVMPLLWPSLAERQILMSLIIWAHGVAGLHYWLRQRDWYQRWRHTFLTAALVLPTLSMAGFVAGGRDLQRRVAVDPDLTKGWAEQFDWPSFAQIAWTFSFERYAVFGFSAALLVVFGWRLVRDFAARRRDCVAVTFDDGTIVRVPPGVSILDASRIGGVAHASVCGGRGRCSTCRVRVRSGGAQLPAATAEEQRVLDRVGAMQDVRLACQAKLLASVEVARLMASTASPSEALKPMDPAQGVEREIVVLFADLRSFTRLAEQRLPYDTVHILNRYFRVMGEAIESHGGHVDKFIGDGIMALYGLNSDPESAAKSSLAAANAMRQGLDRLNAEFCADLGEPLRMGIGLHLGPAIVGEMGYGRTVSTTAIGDTVNTASRLESACKELSAELVVSCDLLDQSGVADVGGRTAALNLRGRSHPLRVRYWVHGEPLPADTYEEVPPRLSLWRGWLTTRLRPAG